MKFRKRPVVIEAWRNVEGAEIPDWLQGRGTGASGGPLTFIGSAPGQPLELPTLEGVMTANPGDWVIRGVAGEVYPCKPAIFEQTYELVEDDSLCLEGLPS